MSYNPSDHPRAPKGTPNGGQFTNKAGVGVDDDLNDTAPSKPPVPDNILVLTYLPKSLGDSVMGVTGEHLIFENGVDMFIPEADRSLRSVYYDGDTRITLPRRGELESDDSEKAWKACARWANFEDHMKPGALSQLDELSMEDAREIARDQAQLVADDIDNQIDQYSYNVAPLDGDEYQQLEQYRHSLQQQLEDGVIHTNIMQYRRQVRRKIQYDLETRRYLN